VEIAGRLYSDSDIYAREGRERHKAIQENERNARHIQAQKTERRQSRETNGLIWLTRFCAK
jgi:hypothetical protein